MNRHRVWAEIDLQALTHNLAVIRGRAGKGVRVLLVVKADAYGHGAVAIARHAVKCGVEALGVSTSNEALELRRSGVQVPILVLGIVIEDEVIACLEHGVHIGIHSSDRRASLQRLASAHGLRARVHLNIDTGMGQLGVPAELALGLLEEIHGSANLDLAGTMTHVAATKGLREASGQLQKARFERVLQAAKRRNLPTGWVHIANSATLFTGNHAEMEAFDTVRPGIAAYGALGPDLDPARELRPVLSLRGQVVYLRDVQRGTPVGYGSTWKSERPTRVATLALGYDDGIPWQLGGVGEALIHGKRAPFAGRVSMDYTSIDVGHVDGVRVGDVATLIGRDGQEEITLEDVAGQARTIPYEIACSVGRRVTRVASPEASQLPDAGAVAQARRAKPQGQDA
ncbi:MAG: alanine racemase [Chlamydiales bacterium]